MLEILKYIPDVVWAAGIASLITLCGVFLASRHSRKLQSALLKYEADQRNRDREMALRREVYLPVAEAIARMQSALMRFPNLNISDEEICPEFVQYSATIAKVQVVGTNTTVQAVSAFLSEYGDAYLELTLKRALLFERKTDIELLNGVIKKTLEEENRYIELKAQLNIEGHAEEQKIAGINNQIEFECNLGKQYSIEKQELTVKQEGEHINFVRICSDRIIKVSQLLPAAIFAVRNELELSLNEEVYLKMFSKNLEKQKASIKSYLDELKGLFENK